VTDRSEIKKHPPRGSIGHTNCTSPSDEKINRAKNSALVSINASSSLILKRLGLIKLAHRFHSDRHCDHAHNLPCARSRSILIRRQHRAALQPILDRSRVKIFPWSLSQSGNLPKRFRRFHYNTAFLKLATLEKTCATAGFEPCPAIGQRGKFEKLLLLTSDL
jgi:hypothetical protein